MELQKALAVGQIDEHAVDSRCSGCVAHISAAERPVRRDFDFDLLVGRVVRRRMEVRLECGDRETGDDLLPLA